VTGNTDEGHFKRYFLTQITFLCRKPKKHSRFQNNLRRKNLLQCQYEALAQFITHLICINMIIK